VDADCAWSTCDSGKCANAIAVQGGQSGTRCALRDSGDVACWSSNWSGITGDASIATPYIQDPTLVHGLGGMGLLQGAQGIAVGGGQHCALLGSGEVACWGNDETGALGTGSASGDGSPKTPALVLSTSGTGTLVDILQIAGSRSGYTCALRATKDAVCWGSNTWGRLGDGTQTDSGLPRLIAGTGGVGTFQNIKQIALGSSNPCLLDDAKNAYCWGSDQFQIVPMEIHTPAPVAGIGGSGTLGGVRSLSVGSDSACAVHDDGRVSCWGANSVGQLGRGTVTAAPTPIPELVLDETSAPLQGIAEVSVGGSHACARTVSNTVFCWGSNSNSQLGRGSGGPANSPVAVQVSGIDGQGVLSDVVALGSGYGFSCGIRQSGDIACWGLVVEIFNPYELVVAPYPALVARPQ
jgi:hypothetical protein